MTTAENSTTVRPRSASAPRLQRAVRLACRTAPGLTAEWAARQFLSPRRLDIRLAEPRSRARKLRVALGVCASVEVSVYGEGPPVALVHGWEGRGLQLGHFVDPLVEAGFSAVVFDMPAHGDHRAHSTSALEFAATLKAVERTLGPLHAVIGHSLGATAAVLVLADGLQAVGAVLLAPMPSFDFAVSEFGKKVGMTEDVQARMSELLRQRLNFSAEKVDLANLQPRVPLLVIHDDNDRAIPLAASRQLAAANPRARLSVTHGLGHQRLLADPHVIAEALQFVSRLPRRPRDELERALAALDW